MKPPKQLIAFLIDVYILSDVKRRILKRVFCDGYSRDDSKREISETLKELSRTAKDGESKRMIEEWMREIEN